MQPSERFSLGVNYWPCRKAMGWWKAFDRGEVKADFAKIAELGLDAVRIFMLWEDFQPEPFRMDESALANLGVVLGLAQEAGLKVQPTFFVGHMSGYNWAPAWTLSGKDNPAWAVEFPLLAAGKRSTVRVRSVYDDPWMLRAMVFNIRQVVGRFRSHPALFGWDTGNEPDVFQRPRSRESQWLWNSLLVGEIKRLDPVHPAVCGVHIWSLDADPGRPSLRIDDQAEINDLAIMHAYSIYCDVAKSPMDTDVVPFCCALTAHLAGKPVLFQEFGVCTAPPGEGSKAVTVMLPHRTWSQYVASEEEASRYVGEVLEKLWRVGALGAWIWCYSDYASELWDRPPCDLLFHERTFGLFRADGSAKPHARALREFAKARRPVCADPLRFGFDVTPDAFYAGARTHFGRLFAGFTWPGR